MNRSLHVLIISLLAAILSLAGCATTYVEEQTSYDNKPAETSAGTMTFPEYTGPKTVVAVLPLGLSQKAAKRYPQLLDKAVGLGIHNRVVDTLYDTKRFRFVEEKPEIIKDVMDRQWMSSAGMVDQSSAIQLGKMLGARKVIYGEVYDFAQGGEKIVGFKSVKDMRTRMGVQVRIVDVETLEYVPGSGVGYGSDVGDASTKAIHDAVASIMRRLD